MINNMGKVHYGQASADRPGGLTLVYYCSEYTKSAWCVRNECMRKRQFMVTLKDRRKIIIERKLGCSLKFGCQTALVVIILTSSYAR